MARRRRKKRGQKKALALSDFINQQIAPLQRMASYLNGEPRKLGAKYVALVRPELLAAVAGIIGATSGPTDSIPADAARRFNALARAVPAFLVAGDPDERWDDEDYHVVASTREEHAWLPLHWRVSVPE